MQGTKKGNVKHKTENMELARKRRPNKKETEWKGNKSARQRVVLKRRTNVSGSGSEEIQKIHREMQMKILRTCAMRNKKIIGRKTNNTYNHTIHTFSSIVLSIRFGAKALPISLALLLFLILSFIISSSFF